MKLDTSPKEFSHSENVARQIRDATLSFEHGEIDWQEFQTELESLLELRREIETLSYDWKHHPITHTCRCIYCECADTLTDKLKGAA
jgi:hypothetical protein